MPPSKEQLAAFEKFDFGGDERWIQYYNNLVIPPGRSDGAAIVRRYKQKFYQKHVDADFEVESLSECARAPSSASSQSTSAASAHQPSASHGSRGSPGSSAAPPGTAGASREGGAFRRNPERGGNMQTAEFLGQAWVAIMAVVAAFPLSPAALSMRCFRFCLLGSLSLSLFTLYKRQGVPRSVRWDALKSWLQSCFSGPELLSIMHCVAFLPSPRPMGLACVPLACHLAPSLAHYLQQNFSHAQLYQQYLQKPSTWLTAHKVAVELFAANMEISLGFLLLFYLLTPQRNLVQAFLYWQLLRLAYHSPATSWYHQQNWVQLGGKIEPFVQQYVPFLLAPLGYLKNWFTNV